MDTDAFGGWITITHVSESPYTTDGELIAIEGDSLIVINENLIFFVQKSDVQSARVIFFNTDTSTFSSITAISSMLTLSNGFFLIFSLPINLITGISISSAESKRINYIDYPQQEWQVMSKYARFPQGLPDGMVLSDLKSRPN